MAHPDKTETPTPTAPRVRVRLALDLSPTTNILHAGMFYIGVTICPFKYVIYIRQIQAAPLGATTMGANARRPVAFSPASSPVDLQFVAELGRERPSQYLLPALSDDHRFFAVEPDPTGCAPLFLPVMLNAI
jgi:hypothetical protein